MLDGQSLTWRYLLTTDLLFIHHGTQMVITANKNDVHDDGVYESDDDDDDDVHMMMCI
jgi:hypothetical protein